MRIFTRTSAFDGIIKIDIWTYNDFVQKRRLIITLAKAFEVLIENSFPFLTLGVGTLLKTTNLCLRNYRYFFHVKMILRSKHMDAHNMTAPTVAEGQRISWSCKAFYVQSV